MGFPFYQIVFGSMMLMISYYSEKYKEEDLARTLNGMKDRFALPQVSEYDFIVVGAGSAGSILANKLSVKNTVLLIENGGNPVPQTKIPATYQWIFSHPNLTYEWKSIKQKYSSLNVDDGVISIVQGRGLGGTTNINGMMYNRGSPFDYDNWAEMVGDNDWKYENLVKYFKMNENFHTHEQNDHIGFSGPMYISKIEETLDEEGLKWQEAWKKAGLEQGIPTFTEPNSPQIEGFGTISESKRFGQRHGAYDSFIKPILDRKTLTISRYSEAKQIVIENGRAVGVKYLKHGVWQYAKAKKEIIVSCGTLNTPLLLLRSGIGPKEQLEKAGIKVEADLPVGQKFQDHPVVYLNRIYAEKQPYAELNQSSIDDFANKGKGPLTNTRGFFAQGFIKSSEALNDPHFQGKNWPDLQYICLYNSTGIINGDNSILLLLSLGIPKSYGRVYLDNADPHNNPLIMDPNWLSDERDVRAMVYGMKVIGRALNSEAFKAAGISYEKVNEKGCENFEWGSDSYWECFVRGYTKTHWHVSGTVRMGKSDDPESALDSKLKVKGIDGLRVVDNSIHPLIPNANTNAPALMIGQKGADLVLKEHLN